MVNIPIINPWTHISTIKSLVNIDSLESLGLSFNTSFLDFSIPIAIAGKLSVTKFINNKWTGANGAGRASNEA